MGRQVFTVDETTKEMPPEVIAPLVRRFPSGLSVEQAGARRDGSDASPAFLSVVSAAKASSKPLPIEGLSSDPLSEVVVEIPAGTWTLTQLRALMGREGMTSKSYGIKFRGAGKGITKVVYNPAEAGPLIFNDYWLGITFADMSFYAAKAGLTFMQSFTTHNAQRYSFQNIAWHRFKYVAELRGDNNNSEFFFQNCDSSHLEADGAWLYIGDTDTSDQFLNYWFYGCTHWSTSAPLIDAARGGHFSVYGLDASDWGGAATTAAKRYLFKLRGYSHSLGVTQFHGTGIRVEAKHSEAALLYSEWPHGNVEIQADWSSQLDAFPPAVIIDIKYVNTDGAIYKFHDSWLAGQVRVTYAGNDWQHGHSITFEDTQWSGKLTPSEAVVYVRPSENQSDPQVNFIRCRGSNLDVYSAAGYGVWDATVGFAGGNLVKSLQKRQLLVHSPAGNVYSPGGPSRVALPVGAIITGLRCLAPQGVVSEGNGGTWTLRTTDAAPSTVATVTVSGARADGHNVAVELPAPFLCSSRSRATLDLVASDVDQTSFNSLVIIDGYW